MTAGHVRDTWAPGLPLSVTWQQKYSLFIEFSRGRNERKQGEYFSRRPLVSSGCGGGVPVTPIGPVIVTHSCDDDDCCSYHEYRPHCSCCRIAVLIPLHRHLCAHSHPMTHVTIIAATVVLWRCCRLSSLVSRFAAVIARTVTVYYNDGCCYCCCS